MNEQNLNGRTLKVLIDFNLIVNSELGLIRFIRENFQDPKAFDLARVNKSDREILSLLYSRENVNPLSIISTKENMNDIDQLYISFMENYKKEIYNRSVSEKSIYRFVSMTISTASNMGIFPSICIESDTEKDEIINHFRGKINFIYNSDIDGILNNDAYYIHGYNFFTNLSIQDKIIHKKIYLSPMKYNLNYLNSIDNKLSDTNQFIFIGNDYNSKGELKHA